MAPHVFICSCVVGLGWKWNHSRMRRNQCSQCTNRPSWPIVGGWWSLTSLPVIFLTHSAYDQEPTFPWPFPEEQPIEKCSFVIQDLTSEPGEGGHCRCHYLSWFFMLDPVLAILFQGVQASSGHLHIRHLIHSHFNPLSILVQLFRSVSQPILHSWLCIRIWGLDFSLAGLAVPPAHLVWENRIENPSFTLQP